METCHLEGCDKQIFCCKYCTPEHRSKAQYLKMKKKNYWSSRYQRFKKEWEKSPNGKRAGISISEWFKLPKDWR